MKKKTKRIQVLVTPQGVAWDRWYGKLNLIEIDELSSFDSFAAGFKAGARFQSRAPRDYKNQLYRLTQSAHNFAAFLDDEYKKPASSDRGKRIAKALNLSCA